MTIKRIDELALSGKTVFVRVDFNVPLDDAGNVTDDTRIRRALPTLKHVLEAGAKLVCASHLGRPKGKVVDALRMVPVGARLAELLGREVKVTDEASGDGAKGVINAMRAGDIVLLENLRFHPGETSNDEGLSRELASYADVYCNDAFGTAHRAHASTAGMVKFMEQKAAGFLMMNEVEKLGRLLSDVDRPFVALLGGAKVSDKVGVLENLLDKVNALLIGGAMANTFIKAIGGDVGASRVDDESIDVAKRVLSKAKSKGIDLLLPVDALTADSLDAASGAVSPIDAIAAGQMALDIGPETVAAYRDKIASAKTLFWNGPMGVFEKEPFASGTMAMAEAVVASGAFSVVGGGDSVAAIHKSGKADQISHISTGGGASLELIEGKTLPGLAALEV